MTNSAFKPSDGSVAIICPSLGKACGIARYSSYVADSLRHLGIDVVLMARAEELFENDERLYKTILIQHEYGLYDFLSPLGAGETTTSVVSTVERYLFVQSSSRAAIIMHTLVTTDHLLNVLNSQLFNSTIPIFHLNSQGCFNSAIPYLEHGIYTHHVAHKTPTGAGDDDIAELPRIVGSFGLLSPNKRPLKLIDICSRANAKFVGNYATHDKNLITDLTVHARDRGVDATIFSDFCDEDVLLRRLGSATIAAVAQEPISHSATSGSVRFLLNLGVPVLAPSVPQFEDCGDALIFCEEDRMHEMIRSLTTDFDLWQAAVERVKSFVARNDMRIIYRDLLEKLHTIPISEFTAYRKINFREQSHQMTLIDVLARKSKANGESDDSNIVSSISELPSQGLASDKAASLLGLVPRTGVVDFSLSSDRELGEIPYHQDLLVFSASSYYLISNLTKLGDRISVDSTIDYQTKQAISRALTKARMLEVGVSTNRLIVQKLSENLLAVLKSNIHKNYNNIRLNLEYLIHLYGNQRGFTSRTTFRASSQILVALPAKYMISYLYRVAGLSSAEILDGLSKAGFPNDVLGDRVPWMKAFLKHYPTRPGIKISHGRPDPRDFRGRTRLFRTELACLTNEEFSLAIEQIYSNSASGTYFKSEWSNLYSENRSNLLTKLKTVVPISPVLIIGLDDKDLDLVDNLDFLEMITGPETTAPTLMEPFNIQYNNISAVSRSHLVTSTGKNDLFSVPLILPENEGVIYYMPSELMQNFKEIDDTEPEDSELRDVLASLVGIVDFNSETDELPFWEAPYQYAESLGFSLNILPEPWDIMQGDEVLSSHSTSQPKVKPVTLPDQYWVEAWDAVEKVKAGRALVPDEMVRISPRAISIKKVNTPVNVDFIVIHKGQLQKYIEILFKVSSEHWGIYHTNEVFITLARRKIAPYQINPVHIPSEFQKFIAE